MKISKATRWILTVGILAILLTGLGITYARQMTEQRELTTNIAQAHQDFIKHTAQKKELETRLEQAKSSIASIQDEFRQYTESIEINKALFQLAKDTNVTIIKLSSSFPEEERLNGITYQVFTLSLTAEGEVVALLNFMWKLSDKFPSSNINSIRITISGERGSLSLSMKIYAYEAE